MGSDNMAGTLWTRTMINSTNSADFRHLVTPGDIITEDTGFMRYAICEWLTIFVIEGSYHQYDEFLSNS